MTFSYTKTVDVNFSNIIMMEDITDMINDILCEHLEYELGFEDAYRDTFNAILSEAYRYVAKELNNMVE